MEKVFEIYIKTTPERLWEAITDPEQRAKYSFGVRVHSQWTTGSSYTGSHPRADGPLSEGENLEVDPPNRLVQRFPLHEAHGIAGLSLPVVDQPVDWHHAGVL